jgi:hypothetical protein
VSGGLDGSRQADALLDEVGPLSEAELRSPNPLHQLSPKAAAWTTINAAENIPGVMTPLGADFWLDVLELGTRSSLGAMGIANPSEVVAGSGSHTCPVNDEKRGTP